MPNQSQIRFDPASGQLVDMLSGARSAPPATLTEITRQQHRVDDTSVPEVRCWRDNATGKEYLEFTSSMARQSRSAVQTLPKSSALKATITAHNTGIDFHLPPLPQGASFYDVLFTVEGGAWVAIYDHAIADESYKYAYDRSRMAQLQVLAMTSHDTIIGVGEMQTIPALSE